MTKDKIKEKIAEHEFEIKELKELLKKPEVKVIKPKNLFEDVKNYNDVCKELNVRVLTLNDFSHLPEEQREQSLAYHQVKNIEKLFNGNWVKDWSNRNQQKWFPWYNVLASSGVVFTGSSDYYYYSYGQVAFYKDKQTSDFVGRLFIEIYKKLM